MSVDNDNMKQSRKAKFCFKMHLQIDSETAITIEVSWPLTREDKALLPLSQHHKPNSNEDLLYNRRTWYLK